MIELLIAAGPLINQSLSAAIATIAASFFLYSIVKDINNRVARAFSLLMLFVLVTYTSDLGLSYVDTPEAADGWLRAQWMGIAFVPAAYVHLSHAILTMTGVPSRGRRRWLARILYVVAGGFLALVLFSDLIVRDVVMTPAPHFRPAPGFIVFVAFFISSVIVSYWFILRARRRTLMPTTHHRLTQLLVPYTAPALAVFPFLLVSGQILSAPGFFYGVLILVSTALAVMLSFMAYSVAFIGSLLPERLVKAQMLQFFMRGPVVAIVTLAVIVWVPRAGDVLGLPGEEIMPMLVVTVILLLQWLITLVRPYADRWLIYVGDQAEIRQIQELEERLLTGADFHQTLDTILTSLCDFLRVPSAFVASISADAPQLERAVGLDSEFGEHLAQAVNLTESVKNGDIPRPQDIVEQGYIFVWEHFWLIPLHTPAKNGDKPRFAGLLGVVAPVEDVSELDADQWQVMMALATRAAEVLEDRRIQSQVFASLEGMLPEMTTLERLREAERHGGMEALLIPTEDLISSEDFEQKIKDALAHYWGGPNLTDTGLMKLEVVRQKLEESDGNPQRAMRAVLQEAIENLRPEGQRSMTTTEWILYNILEMRFIQGRKVRDVAMRLAMSESDLYRKQRVAIEAVTEVVAAMERAAAVGQSTPIPADTLPNHTNGS